MTESQRLQPWMHHRRLPNRIETRAGDFHVVPVVIAEQNSLGSYLWSALTRTQ
jgi:hypothetical protein